MTPGDCALGRPIILQWSREIRAARVCTGSRTGDVPKPMLSTTWATAGSLAQSIVSAEAFPHAPQEGHPEEPEAEEQVHEPQPQQQEEY